MSGISFRIVTVVSATLSHILVNHDTSFHFMTRPTYLGIFCRLYLLLFILWMAWKVFLWPNLFSPLRDLPSPDRDSWWTGPFARIYTEPRGEPQCDWINTIPNNGLIRYKGVFNTERLLVVSPEALAEVLTTKSYDFKKPNYVITELKQVLGMGILLTEGERHKIQRKILLPAFSFRHIKDLYHVFWRKSRDVVTAITNEIIIRACQAGQSDDDIIGKVPLTTPAAVIDISEWANRATLDIIGVAGLGQDFGAIHDPDTSLNRAYKLVFQPSREAVLLGTLRLVLPDWFVNRLPTKRNRDVQKAVQTIRSVCRQLIHQKTVKLKDNSLDDKDILSVALENGGFSESNLIDQLMTFLAAGHETTATAITWAIYLVCVHPEVQTSLRQEIRETLPSLELTSNSISHIFDNMVYLNAVCSEVLRYVSPVPLTIREAAVNTTILNQRVPKGTKVMLVPRATNRDENLWGPDAQEFNPDRWIPTKGDKKNTNRASGGAKSNYATMTFLHGPRSCIGQSFAKAEFAILLAALVGKFAFELNDERELDSKNLKITRGVTARPANGLLVKATVLAGW